MEDLNLTLDEMENDLMFLCDMRPQIREVIDKAVAELPKMLRDNILHKYDDVYGDFVAELNELITETEANLVQMLKRRER